jgi:hypothetical protein
MLEKIIGGVKESENIKPGNAHLARKGVKHANVQIYCVWCLSTRVNVYGYHTIRSWSSSVSIVSDYRLDDRVRSPAEAKDFSSSLCVQTSSQAHPASCPVSTRSPLPRAKAQLGREADHSTPSSAKVKNEYKIYFLSPQAPPWHVAGQL